MERKEKLLNNALKVLDYYNKNLMYEDYHANNKGVHYIIFDKYDDAYIVACPEQHLNRDKLDSTYIRLYTYTYPRNEQHQGTIAYVSFDTSQYYNNRVNNLVPVKSDVSFLLRLVIFNPSYLKLGLGTELEKVFEHYSFLNNKKTIRGILAETHNGEFEPYSKETISLEHLKNFYQNLGYEFLHDKVKNRLMLSKKINEKEMLNYSKRIITYSKNNAHAKIILPKEFIKEALKEDKKENYYF